MALNDSLLYSDYSFRKEGRNKNSEENQNPVLFLHLMKQLQRPADV